MDAESRPFEPVVFSTVYEALIRVLGDKLDTAAHQRFLAHGVNLRAPLKAAYPYTTWMQSLALTANLIAPGQPLEESTFTVGWRVLESYAQTLMGKATMGLLRVIGTRRGLAMMQRSLRTTNNYTETKLTEPAPGVFHLWCNHVTYPHYYRGVFKAGFAALGHPDARVELLSHDQDGATYLISWTEPA